MSKTSQGTGMPSLRPRLLALFDMAGKSGTDPFPEGANFGDADDEDSDQQVRGSRHVSARSVSGLTLQPSLQRRELRAHNSVTLPRFTPLLSGRRESTAGFFS